MTNTNIGPGSESPPIKMTRSTPVRVQLKPTGYQCLNLFREIDQAMAGSANINELLKKLADLISRETDCLAIWVSQRNEDQSFAEFHPITDSNAHAIWESVADVAKKLAGQAEETKQIHSGPVVFQPQTQLVVAPVLRMEQDDTPVDTILLGCFETKKQSTLRLQWYLGLIAQAVQIWSHDIQFRKSNSRQNAVEESIRLIRTLDSARDVAQASRHVVNHLRRLCQAEQVALVIDGTLVAISDVEQVDGHSETNKIIEQACRAVDANGDPIAYWSGSNERNASTLVLDEYCNLLRIDGCLNFSLESAGQTFGSVLVGVTEARVQDTQYSEYVGQVVEMIGGHLDVVLRANQSVKQFTRRKLKRLGSFRWRNLMIASTVLIVLLLCVPFPYRVGCDCQLQPVLRRYVAAPYEGVLERTLVQNGDIVEKGQLLAQMEGRHLRIELAGLQAEFAGARKRRDTALANGEIAQSQIARSEMERHSAKMDLLEEQLKNLEVRSPIDGIIVSGDLEKVEGAPLELGQTLFEVAPLDEMISEIMVPESEIQYVEAGMDVAIKLSAYPFKTWTGQIARIHPRAEVIEEESVFIADVKMVNEGVEFKPGMKGSARISSGWSPLGWNLFHQPWEAIRYWTIW